MRMTTMMIRREETTIASLSAVEERMVTLLTLRVETITLQTITPETTKTPERGPMAIRPMKARTMGLGKRHPIHRAIMRPAVLMIWIL